MFIVCPLVFHKRRPFSFRQHGEGDRSCSSFGVARVFRFLNIFPLIRDIDLLGYTLHAVSFRVVAIEDLEVIVGFEISFCHSAFGIKKESVFDSIFIIFP